MRAVARAGLERPDRCVAQHVHAILPLRLPQHLGFRQAGVDAAQNLAGEPMRDRDRRPALLAQPRAQAEAKGVERLAVGRAETPLVLAGALQRLGPASLDLRAGEPAP